MLFNSHQYLVFLPVVVALTWALPAALRPLWLVGCSYYFYAAWNPPFVLLVSGMTVVNYVFGVVHGSRARSRLLLAAAVGCDLTILAVFKYLGLLDDSARHVAALFGLPPALPVVHVILPLGLSFFTFEFIHYQVDVFRGFEPIRNPIRFALFPAFFPTQIAGPIKRYQDFDKQVRLRPRFDPSLFVEGVELIAIGMFKKVVVADQLLPVAGRVFAAPAAAGAADAWLGTLAFALQIYMDFSGYTDIGRGSAQLLGYRVPINFQAPYLATSLRDFWRRWHISLSSWLRDYLYIPLGGSRHGRLRTYASLMITMALGGLWHGAAWHFMGWGVGHGAGLAVERAWTEARPTQRRLAWPFGWLLTQLFVLVLWEFFRAPDLTSSLRLLRRMASTDFGPHLVSGVDAMLVLTVAGALLSVQLALRHVDPRRLIGRAGVALRPAFASALAACALFVFANTAEIHKFIYFQF